MREDRLSRASLVICRSCPPPPTLPRDPKLQPAAVQMKTINKKKSISTSAFGMQTTSVRRRLRRRFANADSGVFRDSLISNFSTSEDPTNFSAVGRKLANAAAAATGTSDANRLGSRARQPLQPLQPPTPGPPLQLSASNMAVYRKKNSDKVCYEINIRSNLIQAEGPSAQQTEEVQEEEQSLPPV